MRFTPQEEAALRAAVDRILPADDFPGAWEAGAKGYLERQLDGPLLGLLEDVRQGLRALDAEAAARFGVAFAAASAADQDGLLRDVEAGTVRTEWRVAPERFFDLLVRTTAEGFYADPAQGGNRDRVSWAMTGFEPEQA
jgi:hypothetical protein